MTIWGSSQVLRSISAGPRSTFGIFASFVDCCEPTIPEWRYNNDNNLPESVHSAKRMGAIGVVRPWLDSSCRASHGVSGATAPPCCCQ